MQVIPFSDNRANGRTDKADESNRGDAPNKNLCFAYIYATFHRKVFMRTGEAQPHKGLQDNLTICSNECKLGSVTYKGTFPDVQMGACAKVKKL